MMENNPKTEPEKPEGDSLAPDSKETDSTCCKKDGLNKFAKKLYTVGCKSYRFDFHLNGWLIASTILFFCILLIKAFF